VLIDWPNFTPWAALAGGALIALGTALYLLGNGRVAGISGIVGGPLQAVFTRSGWALQASPLWFIGGLLLAPWLWQIFLPLPPMRVDIGPAELVAAGLLVGVGTRMGNGCTSGHGVCGLSRFSLRSLANVLTFMAAGAVAVFVMRHLLKGGVL
jgi:uncharacterized protein